MPETRTLPPALRAICGLCRVLCVIAAVLIPLFAALVWFAEGLGALVPRIGAGDAMLPGSRIVGASLTLVPAVVAAWGLSRLAAVFARFADGGALSEAAARGIRGFAGSLVALAVLDPVVRAGQSLLGTREPGSLGVDGRVIAVLVAAALLTVIAQVLVEAARLSEDSQSII